jgi:hypothetical protein
LCRRKKREEKAAKEPKDTTKKRKAAAAAKKPAKKAKEAETGEIEGDEALAKTLAGKRESSRNRDAKGTKANRAKALATLREVSLIVTLIAEVRNPV